MARRAGPWKRKGRGWWTTYQSRQVRLADETATKEQAWAALDRLRAGGEAVPTTAAVVRARDVLNDHIHHLLGRVRDGDLTMGRYDIVRHFAKSATRHFGDVPAEDVRPHHLLAWLGAAATWGPTTRREAGQAVREAFAWARAVGLVEADRVRDTPLPAARRRTAMPDDAELARVKAALADPRWDDLVALMDATGMRPGEAYSLAAADIDWATGIARVSNKTRRKTGLARRPVYLPAATLARLAELAKAHPEGPLLRNSRGNPWTAEATHYRRKKAGCRWVQHSLRHRYGTRAIKSVDPATAAHLMGHTSPAMILRVYSHVDQDEAWMRAAAERVAPPDPQSDSKSGLGT